MKVTINKKELVNKVSKILPVATASKIDTLNGFIFNVKNNSSFIYATDMEIAVKQNITCNIIEEGIVCIPAKHFYEIVKELDDNNLIEISENNNQIFITSGKTKVKLATYSVEEYPTWKEDTFTYELEMKCETVDKLIEKTEFSIGDNDARYVFNGMLIHLTNDSITFVSTDGHRLSVAKTLINNEKLAEPIKLILPKKGVSLLKKFASNCENITMYISNNFIRFKSTESELSIRLYEGNFPNYESVIPKHNDKKIIIDKKTFISTIKRISSIAVNNESNPLVLKLSNNIMEIECSAEIGEAREDLPVEYTNKPLTIGFNASYLEEAIDTVETEQVLITFSDSDKAVYVTEVNNTTEVIYEHVIMPIRI